MQCEWWGWVDQWVASGTGSAVRDSKKFIIVIVTAIVTTVTTVTIITIVTIVTINIIIIIIIIIIITVTTIVTTDTTIVIVTIVTTEGQRTLAASADAAATWDGRQTCVSWGGRSANHDPK